MQTCFDNKQLLFTAGNGNALEIVCKDCKKPAPNYVLYELVSVVGMLFILAICALLFNKRKIPNFPGSDIVDDTKWTALMIFGLQFWDFFSDVDLAIEY